MKDSRSLRFTATIKSFMDHSASPIVLTSLIMFSLLVENLSPNLSVYLSVYLSVNLSVMAKSVGTEMIM